MNRLGRSQRAWLDFDVARCAGGFTPTPAADAVVAVVNKHLARAGLQLTATDLC
jgi:hypothetical protein